MAESDPRMSDWAQVREGNARTALRQLVALIAEDRTDRAAATP